MSKTSEYVCEHCNKSFTKEKTLMVHMCEPKRRYLQKDERRVQAGFYVYQMFYKLTQTAKKEKTYEEFIKSPYYNGFVKFGSFVSNVNPLYPDKYITWIIKSEVPLDKWCREELYDKYVIDLIKTEHVESACERSINTMIKWGNENNAPFNHYFYYANTNKIVYDIRDGKVSPWLILQSNGGTKFLQSIKDEHLDIISPMIDPNFWLDKFKKLKNDAQFAKNIAKEASL
jgi:hypothetical protein